MNVGNFDLDVRGASVTNAQERHLIDKSVYRITFSNGLIWVYTKIGTEYKNMDFNYQLIHQPNGTYTPDFDHVKVDFKDYFDTLI